MPVPALYSSCDMALYFGFVFWVHEDLMQHLLFHGPATSGNAADSMVAVTGVILDVCVAERNYRVFGCCVFK